MCVSDSLPSWQRQKKAESKIRSATRGLKRRLASVYGVEVESESEQKEESHTDRTRAELYDTIMSDLVDKFNDPYTSYSVKLQILTLSPLSIRATAKRFSATEHMARKAKRLKAEHGVLATPTLKKSSHGVTKAQEDGVKKFFENDDISRIMPGMKDCVSVRGSDGTKQRHQKRLVLANLREIYQVYKNETRDAVGFSTFASLRPPWCVLAGAAGTHSVCVCVIHQNPKLMIQALDTGEFTLESFISKTVCDTSREQCMLRHCQDCPGADALKSFLESLPKVADVEEVEYKQWVTTDRTTLTTVRQSIEEFIETVSTKITDLSRHHFIAKAQNAYLRNLKASLKEDECILCGDFSENYSFLVQDAIQGFHWDTSQATVHPFVAYTNAKDSVTAKSFCVISDCTRHKTETVYTFQKSD